MIFDYDVVSFRRKMTTWLSKMLKRILKPPSQSFFLLGPRGTGKSTWLRALFPDAHLIDLLSEATYQGLLANPGLFANQLRAIPAGKWVVIDEVQRLPALLNEVHRYIEKKQLKFALEEMEEKDPVLKEHKTQMERDFAEEKARRDAEHAAKESESK